jgi:uncharacterized membrane protein (UPF0127 family)
VKFLRLFLAASVLLGLAVGCGKPAPPPAAAPVVWQPTAAQPRLPTMKLYVGPAEITAEIATSAREIQTGMMFRTNVVEDEGMLFVFRQPHRAGFWMKNCPEPLSCAYIDPEGVILEILKMEPHDTNSLVAASDNVMFVLETKRGWFDRHNVRTGMVIQTERGPLRQTFFGNQMR